MSEINDLIKKTKKYIHSAEVLIAGNDYDSSTSRTYYAMFYSAEAVLLKKGLSFSSHKGVISAFGEHFVKAGIFPSEMGRELNRVFEKRQLADYGIKSVITKAEAEESLRNGKKFVETISQYLQEKSQENFNTKLNNKNNDFGFDR
ncbi:MAG TPA: DNA-binding protein [Elusimicrobia bacterium]|nr:DNA-binding protein [Elusimicrobiota bacterium]